MFVAINDKEKRYNLLHIRNKERLLSLRREEQFFCPVCKQEVQLKIGEHKQPHFAHKRTHTCLLEFERESPYHLKGKELLYQWLHKQGFDVKVERYFPSIAQRPDLFITADETQLAIEYQCSTISADVFMKRTCSYWKEGIRVLWILGGNQFKRQGAHWLRLSAFHTLCVQPGTYLLYFCPEASSFFQCSSLIPFSSAAAFSHMVPHPLRSSNLSSVLAPSHVTLSQLQREWNNKKKAWRRNGLYVMHPYYHPFLAYLYEKRIPLSCFPPESLIPLPSLLSIQTPALLWQSFILIEEIGKLRVGDFFSSHYLYTRLVRKGKMKIRSLPYLSSSMPKKAFLEYLHFLCFTGYIEHVGTFKYRKKREPLIPQHEEEAYRMDEEMIDYALRLFGPHATLEHEKRI